jgi:hypothetical protein
MPDDKPTSTRSYALRVALLWTLVAAPLLWGLWQTILKTAQLFQ